MATYQFDTEHAQKYGVNEAIMLSNLIFWIRTNKAEGRHQHDGRTWTYNTVQGLCKLFPFWSTHQVRYTLESLEKQGVVITGDYNTHRLTRTRWFALTDERMLGFLEPIPMVPPAARASSADLGNLANAFGKNHKSMCENSQMHLGNSPNDSKDSDRNHADKNQTDSSTLNVGRPRNKVSSWAKRGGALADEAIRLTGDEKSRKRYQQLAGITLDAGCEDLWHTAYKTTEARIKKSSTPPDCPGAYFCGTLTKLLGDAGIYVPVGSKDERDDVKAKIAASLGHATQPPSGLKSTADAAKGIHP